MAVIPDEARSSAGDAEVPSQRPDTSLPLRVAESIKELIYRGDVKPGERLNEVALAARMGVSRGPIREAIRILTGFGLVTPVLNRGVYVRELTVGEMVEISELRAVVFGFIAGSAAELRSTKDVERLRGLIDEMDAATEAADSGRYYDLNLDFHSAVTALCGSKRAVRVYSDFVKELHLFRRQNFDHPGNMRKSLSEHRRIYEAIAAGSKADAARDAEQHILAGCQRMLRNDGHA
ncbi:GntR family transcriptional regulator [Ottowia thiooxydans]|uniref:GntR family transcriptional regulator n=1 Tax=Ottowia thiooxydans TaxID=219182 RepID=UPI000684DC3E|nr:FCD domain-containing protein [Ottowia thiooxydans]